MRLPPPDLRLSLADPLTPTAPAGDPSDRPDRSEAPSDADPSPGAPAAGTEPKKTKTVKKIVKKVPVASIPKGEPAPRPEGSAPAARPSTGAAPGLSQTADHSALPPPPDSPAPATRGSRAAAPTSATAAAVPYARRPAAADPPVASPEEVRRVGPLQRRRLGRLRARKVRRILRHVEVWSVLKVSIVFYFCLWLVLLVSGALIWRVATQAGLIDNVENFLQESGFDEVTIDGETMFRAWASGGFVMVFASTGFTVLGAVLFNLISDMMGGVRFTVIELETIRRRKPNRSRRGGARPTNRPGERPTPD